MLKTGGRFCFPERRDDSSLVGIAGQPHPERPGERESRLGEASTGPSTLGEGLVGLQSPTLGPIYCPGPFSLGPSGSLGTHPDL